ncbi:MAG: dTDP-Rha:alpha-D-GlcNAc-pyrophosphate polyprenol, alpha-3-L-rhamnosyltransferase [Oscillospiraceae bacterium]|jgi:GT2 family glycosyltransferase
MIIVDLSVIMINYNTKELTAQAVASIFDCSPALDFEIIIVDNSSDSTQQYDLTRDGVRVFNHVDNNGFGNACNIGAANARGKYLLFLNSDTIMHQGTLEQCVAYLKAHPQVGVLGERTLLKDGTLDHACKRGFPTPSASFYYFTGLDKKFPHSRKIGAYRQTFLDERSVGEVDSVAGSFLMMPAKLFKEIGGFDESFFMYGEDLDLCYRVKEKGYQVIYYGKVSITHLKGQSGLHTKSPKVLYHFYNAMKLFYRKHYKKKYGPFVGAVVYSAIEVKYIISLMRINKR